MCRGHALPFSGISSIDALIPSSALHVTAAVLLSRSAVVHASGYIQCALLVVRRRTRLDTGWWRRELGKSNPAHQLACFFARVAASQCFQRCLATDGAWTVLVGSALIAAFLLQFFHLCKDIWAVRRAHQSIFALQHFARGKDWPKAALCHRRALIGRPPARDQGTILDFAHFETAQKAAVPLFPGAVSLNGLQQQGFSPSEVFIRRDKHAQVDRQSFVSRSVLSTSTHFMSPIRPDVGVYPSLHLTLQGQFSWPTSQPTQPVTTCPGASGLGHFGGKPFQMHAGGSSKTG